MWYVRSGRLEGISGKESWHEAFVEIFDAYRLQTGHFPDLGVLGAASQQGFDFNPVNTIFFLTEWTLFESKRIPRMSHNFVNTNEHMASLFKGLPDINDALKLVVHGQDEIFNDDLIDAPNSGTWLDEWDNVIEVPDDYKWPELNADKDASLSGS